MINWRGFLLFFWLFPWKKKSGKRDIVKEVIDLDSIFFIVAQGTNQQRNFSDWKFKLCPMQSMARDHLKKYGVEHYWDLALSESLLENADD